MDRSHILSEIESALQRQDHDQIRALAKELSKSYNLCHSLMGKMHDAILIFRPDDGTILEFNARAVELFNRPAEELNGLNLRELHPKSDGFCICTEFYKQLQQSDHFAMTLPAVKGSGEQMEVDVSFTRYDSGGESRVQGIYRDITERVRMQQEAETRNKELEDKNRQLEESQQLRAQFLATISHELRTPLNAIIGYNSLLEDGIYGALNEKQQKASSRIDRNATRLLSLINQLLDLSRLEAGAVAVFYEKQDLVELVKQVLDDYQGVTDEKGLELQLSHPHKGLEINTDGGKVREMIRQLISNAVKFTSEGFIKISMGIHDGIATVEVTDSGPGISPEMKESIFEMFRQVDASYTRRHEGAGVGLAIVKRLSELLNIRVELKSGVGNGATFRLHIPDYRDETREERSVSADSVAGESGNEVSETLPYNAPPEQPQSVLIVDDDPYTVEILSEFLETRGRFRVTKAFSGMHAMLQLAKSKPDYLLVDLLMPQINGERVIQYCRELWGKESVAVIVITGKTLEGEELERIKTIAQAVIAKGDLRTQSLYAALEGVMRIPAAAVV